MADPDSKPGESDSRELAAYRWEIGTNAAGKFVVSLVLEQVGSTSTSEAQAIVQTEDEARQFILARDPHAVIAVTPSATSR